MCHFVCVCYVMSIVLSKPKRSIIINIGYINRVSKGQRAKAKQTNNNNTHTHGTCGTIWDLICANTPYMGHL